MIAPSAPWRMSWATHIPHRIGVGATHVPHRPSPTAPFVLPSFSAVVSALDVFADGPGGMPPLLFDLAGRCMLRLRPAILPSLETTKSRDRALLCP